MRHEGTQIRKSCCTGSHLTTEPRQQPQVGVVAWEWQSGAVLWHISELVQHNTSGPNSTKVIPQRVETVLAEGSDILLRIRGRFGVPGL